MEYDGKIKLGLNKIDYNLEVGVSNKSNTISNRLSIGGSTNSEKHISDTGVVLKGKISDVDLKLNLINNEDEFKLVAESKYNLSDNCKMGLKYENKMNDKEKDNQLSFLLDANYNLDGTKIGINTEKVIYGEHKSDNLDVEKFGYLINPYIETGLTDKTKTRVGLVYQKKELINEFGYHEVDYDKYLELSLNNNKN
tara:strand:+ start:401 stop:988 length:588 start_codon:yes stop_codon:yes gene_type:complete